MFSKKNPFCLLLTGTIEPYKFALLKRRDPTIRAQDYLDSLTYWLTKTNLPLVFCENSGYDLKNIRDLCRIYPGRIEILQFHLAEYEQSFDYGYGEYRIIEYAMDHSVFLKNSENIVKVTGRVFIANIENIIAIHNNASCVEYTKHIRRDSPQNIHTILFIFKKEFFGFLQKNAHLLKNMNFEDFFEKSLKDAKKNGHIIEKIKIHPLYRGVSGYMNKDYNSLIVDNRLSSIFYCIKYIPYEYIGKIIFFLKIEFPFLYQFIKPYIPDKK